MSSCEPNFPLLEQEIGACGEAQLLLTIAGARNRLCDMKKQAEQPDDTTVARATLKRELEKGLASGVSKRTPAQIRTAFRKAREAL